MKKILPILSTVIIIILSAAFQLQKLGIQTQLEQEIEKNKTSTKNIDAEEIFNKNVKTK